MSASHLEALFGPAPWRWIEISARQCLCCVGQLVGEAARVVRHVLVMGGRAEAQSRMTDSR